ncbi:unnamed protein product [Paramecium sonneborni]|uniref:NACHT domain-containing protein n=1 Tax=Paramecium sonneborni TaxID=65129 RepID=A0A8S1QGC5_9CILI|nr:unnamed protein product [Paramecium sonneborni]
MNNLKYGKSNLKQEVEIIANFQQIIQNQTINNQNIQLGGGGQTQMTSQTQFESVKVEQKENEQDFFKQDIFQYLQFQSSLLKNLLSNKIEDDQIKQLNKIIQWFLSKGQDFIEISSQNKLDQRQLQIIQEAIQYLLKSTIYTPTLMLSFSLIQLAQNLFHVLYQQARIYDYKEILSYYSKSYNDDLQQIEEKFQNLQGLKEIFDDKCNLMRIQIQYLRNNERSNLQAFSFIFQQNKYENQNEVIFELLEDAKSLFKEEQNDMQKHHVNYFFQSLKWTIIKMIINHKNVSIDELVNQLSKGYHSIIQNQQQRVIFEFFLMLLDLILFNNCNGNNDKFNQLSMQLGYLYFQDKKNIWEDFLQTKCDRQMKCYLAFYFTLIVKKSHHQQQKIVSAFQSYIKLIQNSEQNIIFLEENNLDNLVIHIIDKNQKEDKKKYYIKQMREKKEIIQKRYRNKIQNNFNSINIKVISEQNKVALLFDEFDIDFTYQNDEQQSVIFDFLWNNKNKSDVLLIKGKAGSGKTTSLKRLEFFLWNLYDSKSDKKQWIPLYVELSNIEDPHFEIWKKTLKQIFDFNKEERRCFQKDIEDGKLHIVLLFDGYDELKTDQQKINLIKKNKIFLNQLGKNVKVIITTRIETLNQKGYQVLFKGEKNLTDVQIIDFEDNQIQQYLEQYCIKAFRKEIYDFYEKIYIDDQLNFVFKNDEMEEIFQYIWKIFFYEDLQKIVKNSKKSQSFLMCNEDFSKMINKLITILECEHLQPQRLQEFQDRFKKLQNQSQLMEILEKYQIKELIQTPYAFKIILKVLENKYKFEKVKETRKIKFESMLEIVMNEQIIYNDQAEQDEYSQNLMDKLDEVEFFESFKIESLVKENNKFSDTDLVIIDQALELSKFTLYQIYKLYIDQHHKKQEKKINNCANYTIEVKDFIGQINNFEMELAVNMSKEDIIHLNVKKLVKNFFKQNYFEEVKYDPLIKCALIKLDNNIVAFQHKSIQDFFVGKYIMKFFKDFNRSVEENIESSIYNQNNFNLSHQQFEAALDFIKNDLKNLQNIKTNLIYVVELSKQGKCIRAASNSIFLINYLKLDLIGQNLSGIQLEDTNVSGLNFFGSNLDGSRFEEVKIQYCNFNNTSLKDVEWLNTPWNHVEILKGEKGVEIVDFIISPDNRFLITCGRCSLLIWNLEINGKIKNLTFPMNINTCVFSSDSSKFLISLQGFIQIYLIDRQDIKLLLFTPYQNGLKFTFYNNEDKIICTEMNQIQVNYYTQNEQFPFQSFPMYFQNLAILDFNQESEKWTEDILFRKQFTAFQLKKNGDILLGKEDGSISELTIQNKQEKCISQFIHKSQISQLQETQFEFLKELGQINKLTIIISTSKDLVNIFWYNSKSQTYQKVNSLPSSQINGQLPRYLSFNIKDLILIIKDHIVFYDKSKIIELKQDKIFEESNCIIQQDLKSQQHLNFIIQNNLEFDEPIFVAKNNCIEIYNNNETLDRLQRKDLTSQQILSMKFCVDDCLITYNKDETIRFFIYQNSQLYEIKDFIKGQVKNLSSTFVEKNYQQRILKIVVQTQKNELTIYQVQILQFKIISQDQIIQDKDSKISYFLFSQDGNIIYLSIDNKIYSIIIQNKQQEQFQLKHEQEIQSMYLSNTNKFLISYSLDNVIFIWDIGQKQVIHQLRDKKIVDLLFKTDNEFILKTQNSIIWYNINIFDDKNLLKIKKYYELEENLENNNQQQSINLIKIQDAAKCQKNTIEFEEYYDQNLQSWKSRQVQQNIYSEFITIKKGNNMILKHLIEGDQTKVLMLDEEMQEIVFINKDIIISKMNGNILNIVFTNKMETEEELQFNSFVIKEEEKSSYTIIATQLNQNIQLNKINNNKQWYTTSIDTEAEDIQTFLAISNNCDYLAQAIQQKINIYLIKYFDFPIKLSTINIDYEVKQIDISNCYKIYVQSQDFLYKYQNLEQITKIQSNLQCEPNKIHLNYNNKLLAIQLKNCVQFYDISDQKFQQLQILADCFSSSIDNKSFAISNKDCVQYYDFDWKGLNNYLSVFEIGKDQIIANLFLVQDPNKIFVLTPNDIQIWKRSEKKLLSIVDIKNNKTKVLSNEKIAQIDIQRIIIGQKNISAKLYNREEYGFKACNLSFSWDGKYILYYKNNNHLVFQNLNNPQFEYTIKELEGQSNISFSAQSKYLINFSSEEKVIEYSEVKFLNLINGQTVFENYLNVWDAKILSKIKSIVKIPILKKQRKIQFYKESFISMINSQTICVYDIEELIKDCYDKLLIDCSKNINWFGMNKNETKFITVTLQNQITIFDLKTKKQLQIFHPRCQQIFWLEFTEDEKFMVLRDTADKLILWNLLENCEQLEIQDNLNLIGSAIGKEKSMCYFVKLENSLGITCQKQNQIVVYDLKDFKSYQLFMSIRAEQSEEIIRHYVYSNNSKIGTISVKQNKKDYFISIWNLKTKQKIEAFNISQLKWFFGSPNSDNYYIKEIPKQYSFGITHDNKFVHRYSSEEHIIEMHEFSNYEKNQPILNIFMKIQEAQLNSNESKLQVNNIGNKYITYHYNFQIRIIDLELYKKQVKVIRLEKFQDFLDYQYHKDYLLYKEKKDKKYNLKLLDYRNGQQFDLFDNICDKFIVAFSNDGQYFAQGWDNGLIKIYEYKIKNDKNIDFVPKDSWMSQIKKKIELIKYTSNDKILISSQDSELAFWNVSHFKDRQRAIQYMKIDFKIISIAISPNGSDIALNLESNMVQILTVDESKCNAENQNSQNQYIGCYKSLPKLEELMTQHCIVTENSKFQDQNQKQLKHLFQSEIQYDDE